MRRIFLGIQQGSAVAPKFLNKNCPTASKKYERNIMMDMQSLAGKEVGDRYRLLRYLDAGCFGAVYLAEQMAYGVGLREVAIKISRQPMSDAEARATFHDALIMTKVVDSIEEAALREHFVIVHDAGRCPDDGGPLAGHPYMVMELVRGRGMHHHLKVGPFPLKRALALFAQMLAAVAFMHRGVLEDGERRPVVHRDLKPANFLVVRHQDGREQLKLTDFGLAVSVDTLLGWTESGGTMDYLAPESFSHNICSPQSDLYALGLIFYEMLTGVQPFEGIGRHLGSKGTPDSHEARRLHLRARQTETFPLLDSHEELRRRPALASVLRQALTPDMHSRPYRDAIDLRAAWGQALCNESPMPVEMPWENVRHLLGLAEQNYAAGDRTAGDRFLQEADACNRNLTLVPNALCSGRCYLLSVRYMLHQGKREEATRLALEGFRRRPCRSTLLAVAETYQAAGSPAAAKFFKDSEGCKDRE
jgi:serine/threonine protein kinase